MSAFPREITVKDDGHSNNIRVFLVDDDDDFREAATGELCDLGFAVTSFADGEALLAGMADGRTADVLVLDWSLPTLAGIDVLPRLRSAGIAIPVVFLTGHSAVGREHLALDHGALDFVDKARGMPVLAKRLRIVAEPSMRSLEPATAEPDDTFHCGRLMLRPRNCRALWDDVDVNLTLTEFNIVRLLASQIGDHVSYRAVYDCMHHVGFIAGCGADGYRINVRSLIKRIRNKFKLIDPGFSFIENYPSFGYRWGGFQDAV